MDRKTGNILRALTNSKPLGNRSAASAQNQQPKKRLTGTRDYIVRDRFGVSQAIHRRFNYVYEDGSLDKKFLWFSVDGKTASLEGRPSVSLPFYGTEKLDSLDDGDIVIVTEGEKACESLWERGFAAVSTTCGAQSTPNDAVLSLLIRFTVYLWPDRDDMGASHMERISARLLVLGTSPWLIGWQDAPKGGDAADFLGDVHHLLKHATPVGSVIDQLPQLLDRDAVQERLVAALEVFDYDKARKVAECGRRFAAFRCPSHHLVGKRITCGNQFCPHCGPSRMAIDWRLKMADLIKGTSWRLYEIRPSGGLEGPGSIKALRKRFIKAKERSKAKNGSPSIIYGIRLTKGMKPLLLLAEEQASPLVENSAFERTLIAERATADEVLQWLSWHYEDEAASSWENATELALLIAEWKGRHRFQAAGPLFKGVSNSPISAKEGNKAPPPPSGGSGHSGSRVALSCPICHEPLEKMGWSVEPGQIVERIGDTPWHRLRPIGGS
jgi:hypothetical protein